MRNKFLFVFVFLALAVPPVFIHLYPDKDAPFRQLHPRLITGDEPHYFTMLQSLIVDGDLDVHNNYARVPEGYEDRLDYRNHHTWVVDTLKKEVTYFGVRKDTAGVREYSRHGVGLPLLAYPLAKIFRLPPEYALRLLSLLMTLLALYLFYRLLRADNSDHPGLKTMLLLLSTPLWHYSGSLFTESTLAALFLMVIFSAVEKKNPYLCSVLIFIGGLVKLAFLVLYLPAFIFFLMKDWRDVIRLGIPLAIGLCIHLFWNYKWFYNPLLYNQSLPARGGIFDTPHNIILRLKSYLISPQHGLVFFVPFLALLVLPPYGKDLFDKRFSLWWICWILAVTMVSNIHDGTAYGPRQLLPVIPLLAYPLLKSLDLKRFEKKQVPLLVLLLLSVLINFQSVAFNSQCYAAPPWQFFMHALGGH